MDRDEALKLLRGGPEGVKEWNRRVFFDGSEEIPDLNGAILDGAKLEGFMLRRARLYGATLNESCLHCILDGAELVECSLVRANLCKSSLDGANLSSANLEGAILDGASLAHVILDGANLNGASFVGAKCSGTVFANVDLSKAMALGTIVHMGPSALGMDSLIRSRGKIPEAFLRGCGIPDAWIANLPALIGALEPIQFYSVFISYSSKNAGFAERLHADLQSKGVRCWFAPEDLKIGERIRVGIDEAIRVHDKLLLVLSEHSVMSDWVEKEVETAMEREQRQKRTVLFPIRLDDGVMKAEVGWAADIRRSRNIGDFRRWKDHDTYQKSFDRLLRDLKAAE
jgi:uncharacterized protein YjbI with pentapeptide repeats